MSISTTVVIIRLAEKNHQHFFIHRHSINYPDQPEMFARITPRLRVNTPLSHRFVGLPRTQTFRPPHLYQQTRNLRFTPQAFKGIKALHFVVQVLAGFYFGSLVVFAGLFAFLYFDANSRQRIPFELSINDQITAVKAINKDDVLKSPRYAVKHYRRLLIELAKREDPDFDESTLAPFEVPLMDPEVLVYDKSPKFANFYIDIVMRYAKALLAKGQLEVSINVLSKVIDNELIFNKLGDAERLAECTRVLAKVVPDPNTKIYYLQRAAKMLGEFYTSVKINDDFLLEDDSKFSDETLKVLNDLAYIYVGQYKSKNLKSKEKEQYLNNALKIYLANLRGLTHIREALESGTGNSAQFPLFDCDRENLVMLICELRVHISQIMWAKGYKKNAISWAEENLLDIYHDHRSSSRGSYIIADTLDKLTIMYENIHDPININRCEKLGERVKLFDFEARSYYDRLIKRWSNILYHQGPLGILEKPLRERFGKPQRVPEIEEIEDEDEEV